MLREARSHQLLEQLASAQGLHQRGNLLRAERGVVYLLISVWAKRTVA